MKLSLLRYLLVIACFWSGLANAEDVANLGPADLMGGISEGDMSIRFLSNLFGVVDGVLHGSGSQIFGAMFGVFNAAVLTLGTTILSYTLFVSTLRTAHEGEMLGRNWSSMWIPFKSASGFALLLPKASGYSIIQIFVMWTVVQGVSAANLVWDAALDYLNSGGAIIQPQTPTLTKSVTLAGKVLSAETCMFMLQEALVQDQAEKNKKSGEVSSSPIPSFADSLTSAQAQPGNTGSSRTITFPGKMKSADGTAFHDDYVGICGNVTWSASATNATATTKQVDDARSLAVNQVITDLVPYAQQIAKDYGPFTDAKQTALTTMSKTVLKDAANDYEGIIGPAVNLMASDRSALTGFISEAKKEGWIMAGSYYKNLIDLNRAYAASENAYPTATVSFTPDKSILPLSIAEREESLNTFFTSDTSLLGIYIKAQVDQGGNSIAQAKKDKMAAWDTERAAAQFFDVLFGLQSIIQGFLTLADQTGSDQSLNVVSPISAAAILGSGLINFAVTVWVVGTVVAFGVQIAGALCSAVNPVGMAFLTALLWLIPILTAILILCFVVGSTLCFYLPMVPYILFLFGGIGWLIGVIESIAAAPLVALGIAYPEGHELLGKADPAVMLLTNIFIRPSLMVIGFIAGISLSYVGVWLLNAGFSRAYKGMLATGPTGMAWIFSGLAILSIYTALIVQIINQAFSLIHVLPDEVLRWVGGGGKQFGEAQGEQAVRGGVKGDFDQTSKGGADTTGGTLGTIGKAQEKEKDSLSVGKGKGDTPGSGPATPV
jgi:hypothetical protein